MATALYSINEKGQVYAVFVEGINPEITGDVTQKFNVPRGAWSAYYNNGNVTYPAVHPRHGQTVKMNVRYDVKIGLFEFETLIKNEFAATNKSNNK